MKQALLSLSTSLIISALCFISPQVVIDENFSYPPGNITGISEGNWVEAYGSVSNIIVQEGNLNYPGYVSSGIGNYIFIKAPETSTAFGVRRDFLISIPNVYFSFLINVKDTLNLKEFSTSGEFFCSLLSGSISKMLVLIKKSSQPGNVKLGISKTVPTYGVFAAADVPVSTPTLVVIRYKVVAGTSNDSISIWINPPLSDTEPQPDISSIRESDINGFSGIIFRQMQNSGNIYIDGLRVASAWGNAPLPVELTSFNVSSKGDKILLSWQTATEIDNFGFDIERRIVSKYKNEEWKKIGFAEGHGNCNSPRYYSFDDKEVYNFCNYSYRLKQINTDGSFSYSDETDIAINFPGKYHLYQNYPNPFNPSTVLRFSIPEDSYLKITLYNILGQKEAEVYSGYTMAGDHMVNFDAGGLPGGVYFCVLESGRVNKTIKIMISR
jgi:hypothetical protein